MKSTILLFAAFVFLAIQDHAQTVTDIDGNIYTSVIIGTQKWLQHDLKVRHYNNGDSIPFVTDTAISNHLATGAFFIYNNDTALAHIYGNLYNWYAVNDTRKICPSGWHVPSQPEWITLANYLGGFQDAGGKMKETGIMHWYYPNTGATNSSGFTALPGGQGEGTGSFALLNYFSRWWSSTTTIPGNSLMYCIRCDDSVLLYDNAEWYYGFYARCICDSAASNINNYDLDLNIKVYPNPSTDKIIIECTGNSNLNLFVYDIFGRLVLQREINKNKNVTDISNLARGTYIIKVVGRDWTTQKKIIKE